MLRINNLEDVLGDKMSAIDEYGERRYKKGFEKGFEKGFKKGKNDIIRKIIANMTNSGMKPEEISIKTEIDLKTIKEIINKNEQDKH